MMILIGWKGFRSGVIKTGTTGTSARCASRIAPFFGVTTFPCLTRVPSGKISSFSSLRRTDSDFLTEAISTASRLTGKARKDIRNLAKKRFFSNRTFFAIVQGGTRVFSPMSTQRGSAKPLWLPQRMQAPSGRRSKPRKVGQW